MSDRFLGGILACGVAEGLGTAVAVARDAGGVVVAVEAAGVVAGGIEPGDDILFLVEHLHVFIDAQAA